MSVFGFLISGAPATIAGDLSPKAQATANGIAREFASRVLNLAASQPELADCNYLFVGCDKVNMHFGFVRTAGETIVNYRDYTALGQLELPAILQPLREEVGEILWSFSCPYSNVPPAWTARYIESIASQYVGAAPRGGGASASGG